METVFPGEARAADIVRFLRRASDGFGYKIAVEQSVRISGATLTGWETEEMADTDPRAGFQRAR